MSWLSKALGGVGHTVGKVASNPWVQGLTAAALAATGVGAPAAAAIMAAERGGGKLLAPGGNIGDALAGGAQGAAMGYGASKLGGILHGGSAPGGIPGAIKGAVSGGVGGLARTALSGAGSFLGSNVGGTGLNPLTLGLAGAGVANAAQLGNKANDFADKAWNATNDSYAARAGLRSGGIDQLMHPVARNTSDLTAIRGQNSVARRALAPPPPPQQLLTAGA